jgi:hypothetical protein
LLAKRRNEPGADVKPEIAILENGIRISDHGRRHGRFWRIFW